MAEFRQSDLFDFVLRYAMERRVAQAGYGRRMFQIVSKQHFGG